ncbi:MAG: hypothetical protein DYG98_18640 [Haliscomenobacteraceae bacterium CHB4]|nr:hypothetical protein [Haliscomenobacteraceae bacterium CHB4]
MSQFTSISEVARIAEMSDPALRNLHITQSYHELSLVFSKRTGPCANWCTFATWASRQAGQTIRKEDLVKALENNLAAAPSLGQSINDLIESLLEKGARMDKHSIVKLVWETLDPKAAMNRASDAVARGNQKVYAEIGREFARFLETCGNDNAYDDENIGRFCDTLKPGDPPDGQQYLKQAFKGYYEAFFEPDNKKKAELILLANIEIGFHEQTRLQPEIAEGMEAYVTDPKQFKDKLIRVLFPNQSWITSLISMFRRYFNMPTPLDIAAEKFATEARRRIRLFLTARMMELGFPQGVRLHLGKDLKANFPPDLQNLTYPDLIALLKKIDPTPDNLADTGAIDWANLYDRLHFIADLFRCYQETPDLLLEPPFGPSGVPAH